MKYIHLKKVHLLLLIFLFGCSQTSICYFGCNGTKHMSILCEPIDKNRLASVHVNAPDPLQEMNKEGVRFYIHWKLPKEYSDQQLSGILKIRFNDPHQLEIPFPIESLKGHYIHDIVNQEYFEHSGIMAYKVEIFAREEKIDYFEHKLWTDLISFEEN